ncbi:Cyclic-di-GMP receptor FimW [Sinobacterium norvegicum]|uniref:Cyclic-di-GMP receptor FimW n=1 Tax=Sinobacterium norvegicum TaxID=1641715 RepID=A0ABM9AEP1_9GAMM|nr:hypothetical protein [Sinobacterium norvegicum]CAH0991674.1 Cyclic-di-GMP receptor FimW [Sinobacterium norvegicum]
MSTIIKQFKLPTQDLDKLSFCRPKVDAISAWIEQLPKANLGETSRRLYTALDELNRLPMAPSLRMELMELIRPEAYYASQALSKHFLNQPAVLPKQARQVAKLAHALQQRLSTGYLIIATSGEKKSFLSINKKKAAHQRGLAIHRALSDQSILLLRYDQLYDAIPAGFWQQQHLTYSFAVAEGIEGYRYSDHLTGGDSDFSITHNYHRTLLLGCIKANQLRQEELGHIYSFLQAWSLLCNLEACQNPTEDQLIVDLNGDAPPYFQAAAKNNDETNTLFFNTAELIDDLSDKIGKTTSKGQLPSNALLQHLIVAWGSFAHRSSNRISSTDKLYVCVGLATTHFHIAGQKSVDEIVLAHRKLEAQKHQKKPPETNRFLQGEVRDPGTSSDVWGTIYEDDSEDSAHGYNFNNINNAVDRKKELDLNETEVKPNLAAEFPEHHVSMINVSPGGYCIAWPEELQTHIKTGELLGVRESKHTSLSIAIVRWVKRAENSCTEVGIELLSPACNAYVGRIFPKIGQPSPAMRMLMLPDIKLIGQPATIITPQVNFDHDARIELVNETTGLTIKLSRRVAATGALNQFEYTIIKKTGLEEDDTPYLCDEIHTQNKDSFDILWKTL